MAQGIPSAKRLMIDKANSAVVIGTSAATFIVVFCLVASWMLVGQLSYQNRVIDKKKVALVQLKTDITSVNSLVSSYHTFASAPLNILGGANDKSSGVDTTNPTIVLDALPSKYDFPALATSLEKILTTNNVSIQSITGSDDEAAQASTQSSSTPQPVEMPFTITGKGDYDSIKNLINALQLSIRPINVQSVDLAASSDSGLTFTIDAKTYYQPEKSLSIKKEVVK